MTNPAPKALTAADRDELAAARVAMAGADEAGVTAGVAPVDDEITVERADGGGPQTLSRDEIDSLLGVGDGASTTRRSGLAVLLADSTVRYERLPMLEVVFDRLVRIMTTSLRSFTSENLELTLEQIAAVRFNDYLSSVPLPALFAVFRAVEWDNYGLITVDGPLIYSIVEALLGGRRGTAPRVGGRPYTTIERNLVERLIHLVLQDIGRAFAPLSRVEFKLDRLETLPRFAAIAAPASAAIRCRLGIEIEDRAGSLEILIPYATLEPVRDLLLQMVMGEKFGRDAIWEDHLAREMLAIHVELEAVLDEQMVPLGAVMSLAVGQTLPLGIRPNQSITLRCGPVSLMRAQLGRTADRVAVRVEDRIDHDLTQRRR